MTYHLPSKTASIKINMLLPGILRNQFCQDSHSRQRRNTPYYLGNHLLGSAFFYTTILFLYKRFPVFKENRKAFFLLSIVLILIPFSKGTYIIKLNAYLNDFLLLYFVSLVLFLIYSIHKNKSIDSKKVLDLSRYNFSVRKIRILNAVMSGAKYSTIALNLGCGIATIKKNVGEICTTLQVADKTELLVKYSGYTIQC